MVYIEQKHSRSRSLVLYIAELKKNKWRSEKMKIEQINKVEVEKGIKVFDYSKTLNSNSKRIERTLNPLMKVRTTEQKDNLTTTKSLIIDCKIAEQQIYNNNRTTEQISNIKNPILSFLMLSSFKNNIRKNKDILF